MVAKSCNKSLLVMFLDLKSNSMWDSLRLPNVRIFEKLIKLKIFGGHVCPHIDVDTGHCKNVVIRAGDHLGGIL